MTIHFQLVFKSLFFEGILFLKTGYHLLRNNSLFAQKQDVFILIEYISRELSQSDTELKNEFKTI